MKVKSHTSSLSHSCRASVSNVDQNLMIRLRIIQCTIKVLHDILITFLAPCLKSAERRGAYQLPPPHLSQTADDIHDIWLYDTRAHSKY